MFVVSSALVVALRFHFDVGFATRVVCGQFGAGKVGLFVVDPLALTAVAVQRLVRRVRGSGAT